MLPTRDSLKNYRQIDYIEETENLFHENKAELSLKHNFTDFKTKTETRDKIRTLHKDQEINPRRYNNCKSKKI